ncbi:MAG: flavodoxin [Candidatus Ornithomonoglobus sp.]
MAAIILYFSRKGNNYVNGSIKNLPVGNTEIAAEMIHKLTGADIFKIEPVTAYSEDYSECIAEAKNDLEREARPELKAYPDNLNEYDTIYLGYPNYWGTMPVAVFSILEKYDLSGKAIKPFCTHEGSGMGRSETDIKKICRGAVISKGLAIHGANVKNAEKAIKEWI